jgi:hypothetical protein
MPSETTARAGQSQSTTPDEGDYQAFCAAVSASARSRAFLAEYTRRNRNADTELLLRAIERLQSLVMANARPETSDPIKKELLSLLDDISTAQTELQASILAIRAAKFADLIALVERRITDIVAPAHAAPTPQTDPTPAFTNAAPDDTERTHLTVVPLPEQPELPIPSPAAVQQPAITLVRDEAIMAEVSFVELSPAPDAPNIQRAPQTGELPTPDLPISGVPGIARSQRPANPLASIMALSEEERLALFT